MREKIAVRRINSRRAGLIRCLRRTIVRSYTLAVAICAGQSGLAGVYHVSPNGSNTPPYDTYAKAATDPRDAIDLAPGYGDTVLIHAGSYDVDTAITLPKGLVVQGVSPDSSRLAWVGPYNPIPRTILTLKGDHAIAGLAFVNAYGSQTQDVTGVRMSTSTGKLVVSNCLFIQSQVAGTSGDTLEIKNCEFRIGGGGGGRGITMGLAVNVPQFVHVHHNSFLSVNRNSEVGITASGVSNDSVIIEDNVFDFYGADVGGKLIATQYSANPFIVRNNLLLHGVTAFYWNYTDGVIENNTILNTGNEYFPWPLDVILDDYQRLTIRNNVIVQGRALPRFEVCGSCGPGARIDYTYNAFWPPVDSFYLTELPAGYLTVIDSANFNAYPMFADDSLYWLEAGSPLIDTGDPTVLDMDGSRSDVGWAGGPGGVSYQYPQLPPGAPDSLWVSGSNGLVDLTWSSRPEADLAEYRLYRGAVSGFWVPEMVPHRIYPVSDTTAQDTLLESGGSYFYVVTAADTAGLEGDPSPEGSYIVSGIFDDPGDPPIPRTPQILRVYPNPFNSSTTMEVVIPAIGAMPAPVRVTLYDLTGRIAGIAFDGRLGSGQQSIPLSIRASDGRELAAGVYFARLRVWNTEFGRAQKLVLLK